LEIVDGPFVIYQGSHGDRGAHRADVILPGAAYTEESGIFVNTEGRPQMSARAGFAPGEAKENWAILRALSGELKAKLPYDSISQLRQALFAAHPHLAAIDEVPVNTAKAVKAKDMKGGAFTYAVQDHYLTNPIARASAVMAELSKNANDRRNPPVAAE
jgi:NADH-quinone oxidoreductase subunit G